MSVSRERERERRKEGGALLGVKSCGNGIWTGINCKEGWFVATGPPTSRVTLAP